MEPLPSPRDRLAGVIWLARIVEKARRLKAGILEPEYADRFGSANGVDGQFLGFFQISADQLLHISGRPLEEIIFWFMHLPTAGPDRISFWNDLAVNLGREGYPMAERLPVALATTYSHLPDRGFSSVFEVIEADEAPVR